MNERIQELYEQARLHAKSIDADIDPRGWMDEYHRKFAELIMQDMHRKVIASILITDVVMEEKGQKPTSEDYIQAIHKDFGVE